MNDRPGTTKISGGTPPPLCAAHSTAEGGGATWGATVEEIIETLVRRGVDVGFERDHDHRLKAPSPGSGTTNAKITCLLLDMHDGYSRGARGSAKTVEEALAAAVTKLKQKADHKLEISEGRASAGRMTV